ncbi:MAG: ATP-binding protein [Lachnospiraceae bacterium]|nr:ATP-binding protein [Lachnospiraceae bacterium]
MAKIFNVTGACSPARHYMVDPEPRLKKIRKMVDAGDYFSINRARQYGKTTTLRALSEYLKEDYVVVSLDFQRLSTADYASELDFVNGLAREIRRVTRRRTEIPDETVVELKKYSGEMDVTTGKQAFKLAELFDCFSEWCELSEKPVVLIIDEVDTASDNQVFLDFLAQLRAYYLDRDVIPTFQSVILAGLYDLRNLRRKIRPEEEHKLNSPWNIAAEFDVSMSFSVTDIMGMLEQYETDYSTGMDVKAVSELIYDYTSGYPFLVSRLCKIIDEKISDRERSFRENYVWTMESVHEAVNILLTEKNALFDSLFGKLNDYPEMEGQIFLLLFQGQPIAYNGDNPVIDLLRMFGFVKEENGTMQIANRIFETRLYNYFLAIPKEQEGEMFKLASRDKSQFVQNGFLDMKHVLEKFTEYFDDIYGDQGQKFIEEDGRRYFMLFLKPIINGTGNYYVEARTRNQERTDLIVDYLGEQYIIEMKIYQGNAYNERGEKQLTDYLDHYHLKKGYMLSFNFNKKKQIGVKEIVIGDRILVEAVV